jgi:transcriptional regulator with XRE-family HTH domain
MKISKTSLGLAIRTSRELARLTLTDLSAVTGLPVSALSRAENGLRSIDFSEAVSIADALKVDLHVLRSLAETFEREGAADKALLKSQLRKELNDLQRLALEMVISESNN